MFPRHFNMRLCAFSPQSHHDLDGGGGGGNHSFHLNFQTNQKMMFYWFIYKTACGAIPTSCYQSVVLKEANFLPPPRISSFLFCVPRTSNSCDRDPNHYWHTATSLQCGFLYWLARSATGPPPHFDLDLRGNVIQRGAEAQRHYCFYAVGPAFHTGLA